MYPVNQVILGNPDPLLTSPGDLDSQMQWIKQYEARLKQMQATGTLHTPIWDQIDQEINTLTDSQKKRFLENEEYVKNSQALEQMVQVELLNLVKGKIENSQAGKEILSEHFRLVKKLKNKIVEETDNEMIIFRKFKESSENNPSLTYEEFCRQWQNM